MANPNIPIWLMFLKNCVQESISDGGATLISMFPVAMDWSIMGVNFAVRGLINPMSKNRIKVEIIFLVLAPSIASFFNISVDELIGYDPDLSPTQIQKFYIDLEDRVSDAGMDSIVEDIKIKIKQYYSCFDLLWEKYQWCRNRT